MRKVAHFSTALKAPWSTGGTLWGSARKHDRQIIGIAEVNVQFGHGLAQDGGGGRGKKRVRRGIHTNATQAAPIDFSA